jgi:hypothetical protein
MGKRKTHSSGALKAAGEKVRVSRERVQVALVSQLALVVGKTTGTNRSFISISVIDHCDQIGFQ